MAAVNTLPATYPNVILVNPIPTINPNMATTPYIGAPPRYASIVQRVYPHSMRVPLIVIASIGLLWAAVMSASAFRENDDFDNAGSNRTFDIILGILYASVALLEIYVLVVAVLQRAALAKFLRILVPVGVIVAIAAQTIALVVHYTTKDNFIDSCKTYIMEHTEEFAINGNAGAVTPTIAQEACLDYWKRGSWHAIAWLIGVLILSLFFGMITLSFYRQVINPNFGTQPLNQSFPMYAQNPPPPPGFGQPQAQDQSWMVPPYPGPPAGSKGPYEKGDYQPDAEWAQVNEVEYDRPSGPPPPRGGFGGGSGGYREESSGDPAEDAWQRAQREGVTAHYTGHAPAPRATNQEESGYRVGNTEEDEAWERAKNEGVTAHFTGAGSSRADGRAGGVV